jgi:hypothetical protein
MQNIPKPQTVHNQNLGPGNGTRGTHQIRTHRTQRRHATQKHMGQRGEAKRRRRPTGKQARKSIHQQPLHEAILQGRGQATTTGHATSAPPADPTTKATPRKSAPQGVTEPNEEKEVAHPTQRDKKQQRTSRPSPSSSTTTKPRRSRSGHQPATNKSSRKQPDSQEKNQRN